MSVLFINGSPNKNGNTAKLAAELLKDKEYETLNLTDCTIGAYGQNLPGDGLDAVINVMKQADTIVIGSPVYWHNICGSVRVGSLLWQGGERRIVRPQAVFRVSGRGPRKMDVGSGRIHHEALCRALRHDLRRHGDQQKRSHETWKEHLRRNLLWNTQLSITA